METYNTGDVLYIVGVPVRDRRPAYHRIADDLQNKITTGVYAPGDQLPSLLELCQMYGVSKITARNALAVLDEQGVIAIRHGLRSLVLPPPTNQHQNDLIVSRQQLGAMSHRQEQIVDQIQTLGETLARIQQLVGELEQQVDQYLRQGAAPARPPESPPH